jgi:hypothetical protein
MSTAWGGESGVSTVFFSSSFFFRQRSPCFITKHFLLHFGGGGRCVACGLQLELEPAIRVPVFGSKFWGTFFWLVKELVGFENIFFRAALLQCGA